ncbi:response regulator [Pseudoflavitalea sp. G-6-1-2]|uniref:response regulator transcription factor n=1 Tax=Pseudoflavitalea sp. G-6-1-2 TaxID=2728841 RepID=UPI00146ED28E|nr:response regulator [Pseudoflavitalea sp. G-6-1-2]NML20116.1 response regulator [Pseudoflavitalea sp. G-6-1-2]
MKILVAEDEPIMLKTIELRLKKDGYDVIAVSDGREALKQIRENTPDLLITDIMMPYSSGLELVGAVKQELASPIPVIILSAMGQEEVVVKAFKLGADDFLNKPFSPNELSLRVKRLFGKVQQ